MCPCATHQELARMPPYLPTLPQELGDKFTWTVRLHNGLVACQMRMGRWEDAESELLQVLAVGRRAAGEADCLGVAGCCRVEVVVVVGRCRGCRKELCGCGRAGLRSDDECVWLTSLQASMPFSYFHSSPPHQPTLLTGF